MSSLIKRSMGRIMAQRVTIKSFPACFVFRRGMTPLTTSGTPKSNRESSYSRGLDCNTAQLPQVLQRQTFARMLSSNQNPLLLSLRERSQPLSFTLQRRGLRVRPRERRKCYRPSTPSPEPTLLSEMWRGAVMGATWQFRFFNEMMKELDEPPERNGCRPRRVKTRKVRPKRPPPPPPSSPVEKGLIQTEGDDQDADMRANAIIYTYILLASTSIFTLGSVGERIRQIKKRDPEDQYTEGEDWQTWDKNIKK